MKSRINKLEYSFEINNTSKSYYKNNKLHRDKDLPAEIWKDGSRFWVKNGLCHRDNGKPSTIYSDGEMHWFENGEFIKDNSDEIENK